MTPVSQRPEIHDLLALNVLEAVEIARALVGAQDCQLHLGPELDWSRPRLSGVGVDLATAPLDAAACEQEARLSPGIRKLPLAKGAPTDLMEIGLEIAGPDGVPFAMLQLERVPTSWASRETVRGLTHVTAILKRQFEALAGGTATVAAPMLRLCTLIRELDDQAVSQAVCGLLKVLSDEQPNRVETMAMRICGLAQSDQTSLEDRKAILSPVTLDLLDRAGIGRTSQQITYTQAADDALPSLEIPTPEILIPFAQARLLEEAFDVAEDEVSGRLWFRPEGSGNQWAPLGNGFADGWSAIAAEILVETRDILHEYARMHLIRRRDLPTTEIAEAYELNGVIWWLRNGETGSEARIDGGEWQVCPLESGLSVKTRALNALLQVSPETVSGLSDHAQDWARRMAQSVQVVPLVAIAAE